MVYTAIVNLCKERGISISRLERDLGLGNATIRGWSKSSPRVDNLRLVADYFGVTVDSLTATNKKSQNTA